MGAAGVLTVEISAEEVDPASIRGVAARLPDPATLPAGQRVAVESRGRPRSRVSRWLRRDASMDVPLAVRCSALLARGYVEVGATADGVAVGIVPDAPVQPLTPQ